MARRTTHGRTRPPAARARRGPVAWLAAALLAGTATLAYVSMNGRTDAPGPAAAGFAAQAPPAPAPVHGFEIVREYPHDPEAFTQGLIFRDGFLYESTGQNGRSTIRKVELDTGRVVQQRRLEDRYFGEGLTDWQDRLVQLTWQTNVGFVYDLATFEPRSTFAYPGEGWGLTHDGMQLIMSDGTASLRFLDPDTLQERARVRVLDGGRPVDLLNELEYIDGQVYANVWGSDRVALIDPRSGRVTAWIDLTGLLRGAARTGAEDVLNGIAWDAARGRLFVTGKLWPRLFEIRVRRGGR